MVETSHKNVEEEEKRSSWVVASRVVASSVGNQWPKWLVSTCIEIDMGEGRFVGIRCCAFVRKGWASLHSTLKLMGPRFYNTFLKIIKLPLLVSRCFRLQFTSKSSMLRAYGLVSMSRMQQHRLFH